jgi:hypothetical protein
MSFADTVNMKCDRKGRVSVSLRFLAFTVRRMTLPLTEIVNKGQKISGPILNVLKVRYPLDNKLGK